MVETVDEEAEREKRRKEYVRTYVSPWERAMKGNEELTATMRAAMPGPIKAHPDLPQYKSFNRYTHRCYSTSTEENCSFSSSQLLSYHRITTDASSLLSHRQ